MGAISRVSSSECEASAQPRYRRCRFTPVDRPEAHRHARCIIEPSAVSSLLIFSFSGNRGKREAARGGMDRDEVIHGFFPSDLSALPDSYGITGQSSLCFHFHS